MQMEPRWCFMVCTYCATMEAIIDGPVLCSQQSRPAFQAGQSVSGRLCSSLSEKDIEGIFGIL
jgi:hypothetical protein